MDKGKIYFGTVNLSDLNSALTQCFLFIKEHCEKHKIASPRVLEVGCSTGYFSRFLRDNGFFVYGVEPATAEAARLGNVNAFFAGGVEAFLDSAESKAPPLFDVILFADVLEHLMDPARVLKGVADLLKPDGALVISVPNITHSSIRRMLEDGQWLYKQYGLLDETHRYFFSRHSLRKILARTGFGIECSYHVLASGTLHYAPAWLRGYEGELNEREHTFQIVVRASRPALRAEAFTPEAPPRNILFLSPDAGGPRAALRILHPLSVYCREVNGCIKVPENPLSQSLLWADIIVAHGEVSKFMLYIIRTAAALGISIVYDVDDPTCSDSAKIPTEYLLSIADKVTCPVEPLRERLGVYGRPIQLVPNVFCRRYELDMRKEHNEDSPCTFVVSAGEGLPDCALAGALRAFFDKYPGHSLVSIGEASASLEKAGLKPQKYAQCAPDEFSRILLGLTNGIGLIPLDDSFLSSCKSAIKFYHYSNCGIVSIASDFPPYNSEIVQGKTGLLVNNTLDGWTAALEELAFSCRKRRLLLARAIQHCRAQAAPGRAVAAWKEAFCSLLKPDARLRRQAADSSFAYLS
jgi:2-polyprenyl-3-methyl-5-hydroxy-6-metoxy-1,4-benzoquinol methylase